MDENIFDKINEVDLKKTMETSYIDYAMSVIAARALLSKACSKAYYVCHDRIK